LFLVSTSIERDGEVMFAGMATPSEQARLASA
jgi:hypothetical protein